MNRVLKRPMFRMGGSTGTGITSGLPRASYAEGPGPEGVKSTIERLQEAAGPAREFGIEVINDVLIWSKKSKMVLSTSA